MPKHTVKQGECLATIAHAAGLPWKRIWDDPANEELRSKRVRDVLYPGDVVVVPEVEVAEVSCTTEAKHRFEMKAEVVWLRVRMRLEGEARAKETYTLTVKDVAIEGETTAEGLVEHEIPASATRAVLRFGGSNSAEQYVLRLGELDPVTEVTGVQARLHNLGFGPLEIDGKVGPHTKDAIRRFQEGRELKTTGEADTPTRDALKEAYGS